MAGYKASFGFHGQLLSLSQVRETPVISTSGSTSYGIHAKRHETPVLLDLKPSGSYYMDDLHRADGLAPILRELKPLLYLDRLTVTGRTLGEEIEGLRGHLRLYQERVTQAEQGCDFDFMRAKRNFGTTP